MIYNKNTINRKYMFLKTNIKFIIGLLFLINFSALAQEKKCSDFKTGTFKYSKEEYKKYLNGNPAYANMLWQIMALEIWFKKFVD